ncbi:DUF305 domain-containing protein [Nakamurella sp. GG22]
MTEQPAGGSDGSAASGDRGGLDVDGDVAPARRFSRGTMIALVAAAAVVLLLVGATLGLALSGRLGSSAPSTPDSSSVDAGFAQDMIVHHDQGVLMAHYAEANTTDEEISVMAYDIGYTQTDQIGQMQGWLSLWDLPEFNNGERMGWMGGTGAGHSGMNMGSAVQSSPMASGMSSAPMTASASGALMPGMATTEEIQKLKGLTGEASDTYFLQLMIRHHQGGAPMMAYAAEHATNPVVRNFAAKMAQSQAAEISVMTQMLTERGAEPLPAP